MDETDLRRLLLDVATGDVPAMHAVERLAFELRMARAQLAQTIRPTRPPTRRLDEASGAPAHDRRGAGAMDGVRPRLLPLQPPSRQAQPGQRLASGGALRVLPAARRRPRRGR